ncbi:MAG: hypothetical protein EOM24_09800 [Chloroflexia bacterium]|nr:hypothetical protein [Chloroflexia bacterium]
MTVETDMLTDAALRFSEAIRAERASTLDALANERQAALQIIQALRNETKRRTRQSTGRFAFGLLVGTAMGSAAIYVLHQRASEEMRLGITARAESTGVSLQERVKQAIEAGKRAAAKQEQALWDDYRRRMIEQPKPKPRQEDPLF